MNTKPIAFAAIALMGAAASIAHAAPAGEPADQFAASFDRLLNHAPTVTAPAVPATLTAAADPLRSVLWDMPSYHLPVKLAQLSTQTEATK